MTEKGELFFMAGIAKKRVWISFDLSASKNEDNMSLWLQANKAKKCGPNFYTFFNDNYEDDSEILNALKKHVGLKNKDTVYIVFYNNDKTEKQYYGKFLFGEE